MLANRAETLNANTTTSVVSGAAALLIAANAERDGLRVEVDPASTTSVYLLLGAGTPSATVFHIGLIAPAKSFWNGLIGGTVWAGAVQVFGTGSRVTVTEV